MAKTAIQLVFIVFLIVSFFVGAYVYAAIDLRHLMLTPSGTEGFEGGDKDKDGGECPDLLIRRGKLLYLFNSKQEEKAGVNPQVFNNLDEYAKYLEDQKASGKTCPILFLQQESNTQGQDVYRVRPSPFNQQPGLPLTSALLTPNDGKTVKVVDASRENGYNQNMYAGFDPYGQYVGRHTEVDEIHDSTAQTIPSDNPMDINWGGVLYTQSQVESGKYAENEVTRTNYTTPKGGQVLPIPNENIPPYPAQTQQVLPVNQPTR